MHLTTEDRGTVGGLFLHLLSQGKVAFFNPIEEGISLLLLANEQTHIFNPLSLSQRVWFLIS